MKHDPNNPFQEKAPVGWGIDHVETYDAQGRLDKVKRFNADQLRQVIALSDVQKAVRLAAERRLRKLERA
jgi:hypothetical protein